MKVRASCAGEDEPPNIVGDQIPTHERREDKRHKVRAFPAGEDLTGRLAIIRHNISPTYISPQPGQWNTASIVKPDTLVTILRHSPHNKARGATAVLIATSDGRSGWVWLDHLAPT